MVPRLKVLFNKEIKPSIREKYKLKNPYMVPEMKKIVIT